MSQKNLTTVNRQMQCFENPSRMVDLGKDQHSAIVDKLADESHYWNQPTMFSFYTNPFSKIPAHDALQAMSFAFEPKPFKDGTQLEALGDSKEAIFVPTEMESTSPSVTSRHTNHAESLK